MTTPMPHRWRLMAEVLKARRYHVDLFWNTSGSCFTARVFDQAGRFTPEERQGPVWAVASDTPVDALDKLASLIAVLSRPRP